VFKFIANRLLDLAILILPAALGTYDKALKSWQYRLAENKSSHREPVEPRVRVYPLLGLAVLYRQDVPSDHMCLVYDALFVARWRFRASQAIYECHADGKRLFATRQLPLCFGRDRKKRFDLGIVGQGTGICDHGLKFSDLFIT
jgi:hypothetical protein